MNIKSLFDTADDRAVSPVIGVILMVAITVILAAVIGAFVLDLGSGVQENAQAGANVDFDSTNDQVSITYSTNQNADYLKSALSGDKSDTAYLCSPGSKVTYGSSVSTSGEVEDSQGNCDGTTDSAPSGTTVTDGDSLDIVVTAVKGETSTVISEESGTL